MSKVLVIGIDGATFDIIKPLAEEGYLPNLKKLIEDGVVGELKSTIPPVTVPAVPSFITGKNPGKHGMFAFTRRKKDSYEQEIVSTKDRATEPIWSILNRYNKKVGVFLVPFTYPPDAVDGFMITGFGSENLEKSFYPRELRIELKRYVEGYDETFEKIREMELKGNKLEYLKKYLGKLTETSIKLLKYLINNKEWNVLIVWFDECEKAHHYAWKYSDPRFPHYYTMGAEEYRDCIRMTYQKIDWAIGELIKEVGDNTDIIIMSDHGFGAIYKPSQFYHINEWLFSKGFLKTKKRKLVKSRYELIMKIINKLKLSAILRKIFPTKFLSKITKSGIELSDIDWSKTVAYSLGNIAFIYINLEGREPKGIVKKEDYDKVRDEIIQELYNIKDPNTGEKIIDRVYRKEEIYSGKEIDKAPDLVVMSKELPTKIKKGRIVMPDGAKPSQDLITIMHKLHGILIFRGPSFKTKKRIKNAEIVDLAPTILYLQNVPIPEDMDGKILKEAIRDNVLKRYKVKYVKNEKKDIKSMQKDVYSKEETEKIKERLKKLGYL